MIPIVTLITWLFFINRKYNYWEHFLINTYIAAQLNLMLVIAQLVRLVMVLFTHQLKNIDFTIFTMLFMMAFLFLYGSPFGSLMGNVKNKALIILKILLMNFVLASVYIYGFAKGGILNF